MLKRNRLVVATVVLVALIGLGCSMGGAEPPAHKGSVVVAVTPPTGDINEPFSVTQVVTGFAPDGAILYLKDGRFESMAVGPEDVHVTPYQQVLRWDDGINSIQVAITARHVPANWILECTVLDDKDKPVDYEFDEAPDQPGAFFDLSVICELP